MDYHSDIMSASAVQTFLTAQEALGYFFVAVINLNPSSVLVITGKPHN